MKQLLLTLFLFGTLHAFSQSDLLVLKEKNRIIQTWVPGSIINFQYSSKQWLMGIIKMVRNDSILMEHIAIEIVPNQFGFPRVDTAKFGLIRLHVSEIYGMPKKDYAGIFTNGALLKIGSEGYIFLNLANTLIKGDPLFSSANATRLGVAGGVFLLGTILGLSHKTYITLGKKYKLAIINIR
ncbi:MAG: hypothetical protein ABI581_00575 [Sediminibacterium sp.]